MVAVSELVVLTKPEDEALPTPCWGGMLDEEHSRADFQLLVIGNS